MKRLHIQLAILNIWSISWHIAINLKHSTAAFFKTTMLSIAVVSFLAIHSCFGYVAFLFLNHIKSNGIKLSGNS